MKTTILAALFAVSFQFTNPCSPENQGRQAGPNDQVVDVEIAYPKFTDKPRVFEARGVFDVSGTIQVRANASGAVEKLYVSEGDRVQKDDPVLSLSNSDLLDQIEMKRNRIKEYNARLNLTRSKVEYGGDVNPSVTHDEVEFLDEEPLDKPIEKDYSNDYGEPPRTQRALALVLENLIDRVTKEAEVLDKRLLALNHTSSEGGVVTQTYFSEGNKVEFQDVLMEISKTDPMTITFTLPGDLANFVNKRSKVEVVPVEAPEVLGTGRVFFLSPNIDPATKTIKVKAHVSNEKDLIKGGQEAKIKVTSNRMDRVLELPKAAVVNEGKKNFIFIVRGEQARIIEVKDVFPADGNKVAVKANISIDDPVIISFPEDLKNGSFVNATESKPAVEIRE